MQCAIGAGILLAVIYCPIASAQTAGEMLLACEMLQRGMHVEGETVYIPPSAKLNQCWGFIEAVQQYAYLADQNGKTAHRVPQRGLHDGRCLARQQDGEKTPFSIRECVNLRVAPAARAANSLPPSKIESGPYCQSARINEF